jgi:transcriptional regulator with XRE-family HTH domain
MALQYGRSHLPELLAKAGKTQVQLADHLEVTEGFISQVISGKSRLSVIKRKMTADFLGCTSDDLNEWIYD